MPTHLEAKRVWFLLLFSIHETHLLEDDTRQTQHR